MHKGLKEDHPGRARLVVGMTQGSKQIRMKTWRLEAAGGDLEGRVGEDAKDAQWPGCGPCLALPSLKSSCSTFTPFPVHARVHSDI